MRVLLRCLIALNWSVASLAFSRAIYGHPMLWGHVCTDLACEDLARDRPDLKAGSPEYYRLDDPLADEYRRRTRLMMTSGWYGWWAATIVPAVGLMAVGLMAVGLMVVFPRIPLPHPGVSASKAG